MLARLGVYVLTARGMHAPYFNIHLGQCAMSCTDCKKNACTVLQHPPWPMCHELYGPVLSYICNARQIGCFGCILDCDFHMGSHDELDTQPCAHWGWLTDLPAALAACLVSHPKKHAASLAQQQWRMCQAHQLPWRLAECHI